MQLHAIQSTLDRGERDILDSALREYTDHLQLEDELDARLLRALSLWRKLTDAIVVELGEVTV